MLSLTKQHYKDMFGQDLWRRLRDSGKAAPGAGETLYPRSWVPNPRSWIPKAQEVGPSATRQNDCKSAPHMNPGDQS